MKVILTIGDKYGRLTVLKEVGKSPDRHILWECICDCGITKVIMASRLIKGSVKSCGCINKEITSLRSKKHGDTGSRLYVTWIGIKRRCYYQEEKAFKNYGGRGIIMCDEWDKDFLLFKKWALLNGYKDNLQIDRIDNDGNYEPSNCRWVTAKENCNNKRNNILLLFREKSQTLSQWAQEIGISKSVLHSRINKHKWSIEKAIETPVRLKRNNLVFTQQPQDATK